MSSRELAARSGYRAPMRIVLVPLALALAVVAGCNATNPYDPQAPADLQEPARVAGLVSDGAGPVKAADVSVGDIHVVTGDDGAYLLAKIAPGVVTLKVKQSAHQPFARDLILVAGVNRDHEDITLVNLVDGGHLGGIARKGTEVAHGDQADFSGILVAVESAGLRTVTNSAGRYDLVIAPGTYDLTLSAPDNVAQIVPGVVVDGVTPTEVATVTLAANPGSISGHAFLAPESLGGESHGGVVVSVGAATATTGADDAFQVTGLAAGPAVVRYTRDGWLQAEQLVLVVAGQLLAVDDVTLARATGSVSGTVSLEGAADASGATIALTGSSGTFAGTSAPDGSFVVSAVPTGTYTLTASKSGFVGASAVVDVVTGATVAVPGVLALSAASAAVVIDGGALLSNTRSVALSIASTQSPATMRVSEDPAFADVVTPVTFAASSTFSLADVQGAHTVFVELLDATGGSLGVFSSSIALDTVAPVLAPDGGDAVLVDFGAPFASSVSVTVTFDVDGADAVAVAVDGVVDTESFQPFSQSLTVLLPSSECAAGDVDCASVCAVFKDAAGNVTAPACDGVTLDTTVPAAPVIVERDSVVPTVVDGDASVPFTLHLVVDASGGDAFPDHFEVLIDPSAPVFARVTPGAVRNGQLPIELVLDAVNFGDASLDALPSLIRVRAVDQAGNVSPESAVHVVVDSRRPDQPVLAGAPAATNGDTISVNFQVGVNTADEDATFDHYRVQTTLLPQPFDSFQRDGIVVTLLPDVLNTIVVTAVDASGKVSLPSQIQVRHDDVAPFAPTVSPTEGSARGGPVEISLFTPSLDPAPNDAPPGSPPQPVTRYQLKDGNGQGFKDVPGQGPFLAFLKKNRDNDVCLRGVDAAGNVGIEECALIHEVTQTTIAGNVDHPHGSDIFGDVLVFSGQNHLVVRDLSGTAPDAFLGENPSPGSGTRSELQAVNDFHLGGDGSHVFVLYQTRSGTPTSAIIQLDYANPNADGTPRQTAGLFLGSAPSVDGNVVTYFNQGRVRQRDTTVPPDANLATPNLDANPADLGTDVSGPVTLCATTEPRTAGGLIVWCQEPNEQLVRHVAADLNNARNAVLASLLDVTRDGSLLGQTSGIQQPVVSASMIAWSSADPVIGVGVRFIDVSSDVLATGVISTNGLSADRIQDADGFNLTTLNRTSAGLTNDAVAVELSANPLILASTNDVSPQDDTSVDGSRADFNDTATGGTMQLVDFSSTRWVNGVSQLAFEPSTSSAATVWIQGIENRIALVGRTVPIDRTPLLIVDDVAQPVAFFGPAKADPTYAVGGTRVAYVSGTPALFSLLVRDLTTGQLVTVATDVGVAVAIDPDGDDVVFTSRDGLKVFEVALPTPLPATFAPTLVALAGDPTKPAIMLDLDDGMIMAQRGGDPSRDSDVVNGVGDVVCAQGASSGVVATMGKARGPKVAHLANGQFLLVSQDNVANRARACFVGCASTPVCVPFSAGTTGRDQHVGVSRAGLITYLNDATALNEVVLFDAFTKRRTHLTAGDLDRSSATVAGNRVTYADASLGGFAIFEINLP